MSFIILQSQDWSGSFDYAPPLVERAVNTEDISTAVECDSRGSGPWMRVTMRSGESFIAHGKPSDLVKP